MPEFMDLIEHRFKRKDFENILLVRDGNRVTAILSNGLDHRKEERDFPNVPDAETFYDECSVEAMCRGFVKVG